MISIVLPCFNEEQNIESTVRKTLDWMNSRSGDFEIILVNDGSTDRTEDLISGLSQTSPSIKSVTHEKNLGYGVAVRSGLDAARGDILGFMDSDGQFDPRDFELLLPWLEKYEFVTGRREKRADPWMRCLFGKMLGALNFIVLGLWVRDINCGLKVFKADLWQKIRPVHGVEKLFNTEVFLNLKKNRIPWRHVNVPHYPRKSGCQTGGTLRVIARMFRELWNLKTRN